MKRISTTYTRSNKVYQQMKKEALAILNGKMIQLQMH